MLKVRLSFFFDNLYSMFFMYLCLYLCIHRFCIFMCEQNKFPSGQKDDLGLELEL